jgi:hypothetical protein
VRLFSILVAAISCALLSSPAPAQHVDGANMTAAQAEQRVREIVNRPVKSMPRTEEATVYSPGWFHPGAITPDFEHVDIRQTQDLSYGKDTYVTSDLNPNEMFYGNDVEFNSMTKYFYTDRSLPKHHLSEHEMLEINSLYRIIGREQHARTMRTMALGIAVIGFCLVAVLVFIARRLT